MGIKVKKGGSEIVISYKFPQYSIKLCRFLNILENKDELRPNTKFAILQ